MVFDPRLGIVAVKKRTYFLIDLPGKYVIIAVEERNHTRFSSVITHCYNNIQ